MEEIFLESFQYFCMGLSAILLYQVVTNILAYLETREKWIRHQAVLCVLSMSYVGITLVLTFGIEHYLIGSFLAMASPFTGIACLLAYIRVMEDHFQKNLPGKKFIQWAVYAVLTMIGLSFMDLNTLKTGTLIQVSDTRSTNLYLNSGYYVYELSDIFRAGMGAIGMAGLYTTFRLLRWAMQTKENKVLMIGISLNLAFAFNDVFFAILQLKYALPLSFASYVLEILILTQLALRQSAKRSLELEGEVIEVGKIAEVGAMAGQICHDIVNPLSMVKGHVHISKTLLKKEPVDLEKIRTGLDKIERACLRIEKISRDYLKIVRSEQSEEVTRINLLHCLESAMELVEKKIIDARAKPFLEIDPGVGVLAHENRLTMAFANLYSNSCDAIRGSENPWIKIVASRSKSEATIQFIDSGHGIKPEIAEKIFKSQYTTKSKGSGTGLGLSFVKKVINSYGGNIELYPKAPNTTFVITFPVPEEKTSNKAA